jgi:hypothetical protein
MVDSLQCNFIGYCLLFEADLESVLLSSSGS